MQDMLNELITTATGLILLAGAYLLWLITGIANNLFSTKTWSWKRTLEDIAKTLLLALATLAVVPVCNGLDWFATKCGCDITALLDGVSVAGVLGGIIGGTLVYLKKAYTNILNFVNADHVEVSVGTIDSAAIAEKIYETISSMSSVDEQPTEEDAAPTAEQLDSVEVGLGAASPLARRLADGDNDDGKGWQCSKYSYYLATGVRMNYTPHPDYGPCNGSQMVDYLVKNYGFVRCGKEAGAIFAYSSGAYGHTGMVIDPATNLVNHANYKPLVVSTNYLNLDAVGAVYCKPAEFVEPTDDTGSEASGTEGSSVATETGFKVGDKVVPTKLVDYTGTPLVQWDDNYTIAQISGDRAVLMARGAVWAAMNVANIKLA